MNQSYFYAKNGRMITIEDDTYRRLARELLRRLGDADYFNGSLEYDTDEVHSNLRATLLVYRTPGAAADGSQCRADISDIVPVWWEYATFDRDGQVANDFSWSEFREFLL